MPPKKRPIEKRLEQYSARLVRRAKNLTNREIAYIAAGGVLLLAVLLMFILLSPAAVKVNGMKVSKRRFQALVNEQTGQIRQQFARQGTVYDPKSPEWERVVSGIRNSIVGQQVNNLLLFQEAVSQGLSVPDERVDAQVNLLRAQVGEKNFASALKQKGITEGDLREDIRTQIAAEEFLNGFIRDIIVKGREARDFYEKNRGRFERKDMVKVRHILTKTQADAGACLKELTRGADFALLAQERSQEAIFAAKGGLWGWRSRGEMPQQMETAAFSLHPGQVSDIIVDSEGFHIIKVEDARPAGPAPFAEVKEDVVDQLLARKHEEKLNALLDELRRKAVIEVNL